MTEYRIKISYSTGNSFGSEETSDYLEMTWQNIDIAKENLQHIKEHYDMYRNINSRSNLTTQEWLRINKDKDWFVNKPKLFCTSSNRAIDIKYKKNSCIEEGIHKGYYEYRIDEDYDTCLILKTDNGKKIQMSAFWCGYFEKLHCAEIELKDNDMKINF